MAQPRNHKRIDRVRSVGSPAGGGGGAIDHHDYATQTLFDQIKEKKVYQIFTRKKNTFYIQLPFLSNVVIIGRLKDTWEKQPELAGLNYF